MDNQKSLFKSGQQMKIVYVAYASNNDKSGVLEKIEAQVKNLRALGHDTHLILIDSQNSDRKKYDYGIDIINNPFAQFRYLKFLFVLIIPYKLKKCLEKSNPDVIYFRYALYQPYIASIMSLKAPLVIEINGHILGELESKGEKILYLVEKLFGSMFLNKASGFVGVTTESINYALANVKNDTIPCITIGNGIDCDNINYLLYVPEKDIHMAYVGARAVWGGMDRVIRAINEANDKTFKLHLIGAGWDKYPEMDKLIKKGLIINHGYVTGKALDDILKSVDFCFSILALHRKRFTEASPLKVRRYLAYGIPVVIGYDDTDFSDDFEFILRVPANDEPLDINILKNFARKIRNSPQIRHQARKFAENRLDYKIKMGALADFLKEITSK